MSYFPRGISPDLLLSQVKNTMPYLFSNGEVSPGKEIRHCSLTLYSFPPAKLIREFDHALVLDSSLASAQRLSHIDYFKLCVSAHFLTCATPVPTDVDNQIRKKLWPEELPLEWMLQMAEFVLECRHWDYRLVSSRYSSGAVGGEWEKEQLGGHLGEWFTLSVAAYCALVRYLERVTNTFKDSQVQQVRQKLFDEISDEVRRHSEIFGSLWRSYDGLGCLKASAHIAHNFGDLDRVMDMWDLSIADPLRLSFYKLGVNPFDSNRKLRYLGRLWVAGELYKSMIDGSSMASENHRHFALRKPRCLRQSPHYLIPNGPFFDTWGQNVARGLTDIEEGAEEVIDSLWQGWKRLPKTFGYGRALRGMSEGFSKDIYNGSFRSLSPQMAAEFRSKVEVHTAAFEKKWNDCALELMDNIPSTA